MSPKEILMTNVIDSINYKILLTHDENALNIFAAAVEDVVACYKAGRRLYIAGNGGSAADAQHLAAEFVSKLARYRNPLPAEAITTDSSIITAISNDYGYDKVFSRQLAGKLQDGDMFLGITTSGKSSNILEALKECRIRGVKSIVFTGHDGGSTKEFADYCVIVPGKKTSTIQEIHIVLAHTLCECVENELFPH